MWLTFFVSPPAIISVKRLPAILPVLLCLPTLLAQTGSYEENAPMMSDRARSGLRGAVKSCTEENLVNEIGSEYTREYDSDGLIVLSRVRNTDGSFWVTRYEY